MIDTSLNSSNFYFLLAVIQGFILAILILFQRPVRNPHLFLGILIFLFSLSLLHLLLEESISGFNLIFPFPMDFGLSYGPLAYLHVRFIKEPSRKFRLRDGLHFLPSFLLDGLFFSGLFLYVRANLDRTDANVQMVQAISLFMVGLGIVQLAIYTYLTYRETKDTEGVFREFKPIRAWLRFMIMCWGGILLFLSLVVPIGLLNLEDLDANSYLVYKPMGILISLCIYLLGYVYLLRFARPVGKYMDRAQKLSQTPSTLSQKATRILQAFEQDDLHKDPGLTLARLAAHLELPINEVSTLLNEGLHTRFTDLVNRYRVNAFKALILKPESQQFSVEGLAQQVGFRSKASFYRAFKKEMNMTPTEFLKSQGK